MANITENNDTSILLDNDPMLTETQQIYRIVVRGVLNYLIQLTATFLNVSTIIAVKKYKKLQITSNALIICFSLGNSLAVISGTLSIATDFIIDYDTKTWRIVCTALGFFQILQQYINILSIMAISIERVYCVYLPLHYYQHNSFKRMSKVSICVTFLSIMLTITGITLGYIIGNF